MKRVLLTMVVASTALVLSSCGLEWPPRGGEAELQLAAATTAADVGRVTHLLAAGANPNKMVSVDGSLQSAWFLSLYQLRPGRPELVEIVRAMLKAGADPNTAWGTSATKNTESAWRRFFRTGARQAGSGAENTMRLAMLHPIPQVVRALVDAGLDPRNGEDELVMAIESGQLEIVHILVDAGVDVNSHRGANTPLVAAIEARNVALMTYLEEHGAREKP